MSTDINWPVGLPNPSNNLGGDFGVPVLRTTMDTGRVRQRRRFAASKRETWSVTWRFDKLQFAAFRVFFNTVLAGGTKYFMCELPVGNGMEMVAVRFVGGEFKEAYQDVMHFGISATLETESAYTESDDWYALYVTSGGLDPDTFALGMFSSLHDFVHIDCPDNIYTP